MKRSLPFVFAIAVTVVMLYLNDRQIALLPQFIVAPHDTWLQTRVHASYFGLTLIAWIVALGWYFRLRDDE